MMKSLIIVSILVAGAFAQAKNQEFQCVNNMFREARFDILNHQIFLQDHFVQGTNELEAVLEQALNLQDKISIHEVALQVFKDESTCTTNFAPLVNCTTQADSALLHVKGHIAATTGLSGGINLSLNVKLNKLDVRSHLASEGPINLDGATTVISVNRVNLEAIAEVAVNGQIVELKFTPFFNNGTSSTNSFCKKL